MENSNQIFRWPERAPGSQNKALRKHDQAGLGHSQAGPPRAQGSSPSTQVKAAAAHVERLKQKQCEKS
jgi:hypothetical protein